MAFGMLSHMVAMSIGDNLARNMTKAIGRYAGKIVKWGEHVALPRVIAAGRIARRGGIEAAKRGWQSAGEGSSFRDKLKSLAKYGRHEMDVEMGGARLKANALWERMMTHAKPAITAKNSIETSARNFVKNLSKQGHMSAHGKKVLTHAIRSEVGFLPFNYLYFRYEKYQGSIKQDQGFGGWYARQLPINIAANAAFVSTSRGVKAQWYQWNSRGGRYATSAAMKSVISTVDHLRRRTQPVMNIYQRVMSRMGSINPHVGFFSKIVGAVDKLRTKDIDLNARPRTDHERFMNQVKSVTDDPQIRSQMISEYNKNMGRSSVMRFYNRSIRGTSRTQADIVPGRKPSVEDLSLTHARKHVTFDSGGSSHSMIESREIWQMGKEKFDFGHFHFDRVRDFGSDVLNRDVNLLGRPWLRYLDAGRNLLMSRRTKWMTSSFKSATSPGYLGIGAESAVAVGRAGDAIDRHAENSNLTLEQKAVMIHQSWMNVPEHQAAHYHESRIQEAMQWLRQNPKYASSKNLTDSETVRRTYFHNYIANAREGIFKLGTGESLSVLNGKIQVVSPYVKGAPLTFHMGGDASLNISGEAMISHTTLPGHTRAAQLYAMMNSEGSHSFTTPDGVHVDVGMGTQRNKSIAESKDMRYVGKFGKAWGWMKEKLELGYGHEGSKFSEVFSIFGKFNDRDWLPNMARDVRTGRLSRATFYKKFTNTELSPDTRAKERFQRNAYTALNHGTSILMEDMYKSFEYGALGQRGNDSLYRGMFEGMDAILQPVVSQKAHVPGAKELQFKLSDFAIEMNMSTQDALDRINKLRQRSHMDDMLSEAGINHNLLDWMQSELRTTAHKNAWEALSSSSRGRYANAIQDYNRNLFDMGVKMIGTDAAATQHLGAYLHNLQMKSFNASSGLGKKFHTTFDEDAIRSAIYLKANLSKLEPGSSERIGMRQMDEFVDNSFTFMKGFDEYTGKSIRRIMKAKPKELDLAGSSKLDNFTVVIAANAPERGLSPEYIHVQHLGDSGSRKVAAVPIQAKALETMAAIGTMNSALSFIGLGFDQSKITSMSDIIQKTITKRVLPFAGLYAADQIISGVLQNTPVIQNTPLAGGMTGMALDAYAGMRVVSQYLMDFTGIQKVSEWAEDVMPGIINSPLSTVLRGMGPMVAGAAMGYRSNSRHWGPLKGGIVGGAVGMLLGGGPIGLFTGWDISKNRHEVISELKGEKEVEVRKSRWWELSPGNFWGEGTAYYRPSTYALSKKRWQKGNNFLGDGLMTDLTSYVDPSVYARQHMYTRPYLESGKVGSNIPIIGSMINFARGTEKYHEDFVKNMPKWGPSEEANDFFMYGGDLTTGMDQEKAPVYSSDSAEVLVGDFTNQMTDIAGLRGFLVSTFLDSHLGTDNILAGNRVTANANRIGSLNRQYWDAGFGGLLGATEAIRRIIPYQDKSNVYYDPVPNAMPVWLPGTMNQVDFLHGDPFAKLPQGEIRLPSESYELTHDVFYTYPIEGLVMGQSLEEQVAYYSGDVAYLAQMRRNWDVVETTRHEVIGRLKASMQVTREEDMAYDIRTDTQSRVDALVKDPTSGKQMALFIAPIAEDESGAKAMLSGAEDNLNAYLVMNKRGISEGILVGMDRDGNITKQIVRKDVRKFKQEVDRSRQAIIAARKIAPELAKEGMPISHAPGYSHLNRLKILLDVAPYSKEAQFEMKIVREQADAGQLGRKGKDMFIGMMKNFGKLMQGMETAEYRFLPYLMGKTPVGKQAVDRMADVKENYSPMEIGVGAMWEYVTHLRNPVFGKLMAKRSAYEAYRQDVAIGKGFKTWGGFMEDYIGANMSMLAAETDPVQAGISGFTGGMIFGGPLGATLLSAGSTVMSLAGATSNTRAARWADMDAVQEQADAVKYAQYMQIYQDTGDESALRKAKYTATSTYGGYKPGSFQKVTQALNPMERRYVKKIMLNMYAEDIDKVSDLMPEHMRPMFQAGYGRQANYGEVRTDLMNMRNAAMAAPLQFSADDMTYSTLHSQGMNAHDIGMGFYAQANRMRLLEHRGLRVQSVSDATQGSGPVLPLLR